MNAGNSWAAAAVRIASSLSDKQDEEDALG